LSFNRRRTTHECMYLFTLLYPVFLHRTLPWPWPWSDDLHIWTSACIDILKTCPSSKNGVSRSRLSKVRARTGQTNRQTDTHTEREREMETERIIPATFAGSNKLLYCLNAVYEKLTWPQSEADSNDFTGDDKSPRPA